MMLAASALLMAVSIFLQRQLKSHEPEQDALLVQSNPIRMTDKSMLLVFAVLIFATHFYQFQAFAVFLFANAIATVVQHPKLRRLGANPTFVKRWAGTSVLLFLGGAAFTVALYLGALAPSHGS